MKLGQEGSHIAFKIDLEKAYNKLNRDFFQRTLVHFGFPRITINSMMSCVRSSQLLVFWNGSCLDNFALTRVETRRSHISISFHTLYGKACSVYIEEGRDGFLTVVTLI